MGFLPILTWAPRYTLQKFKGDLIFGIFIASLVIPQGISYDNLPNLPSIHGLYANFVPPLIYGMIGGSRDLVVGTVPVAPLLMDSMLRNVVNANDQPELCYPLVFTATFVAGIFQAALGLLRLGFIVDFLSHATIVGFMSGAATVISLQQLKGILGLEYFTHETDLVSVMGSMFSQTHVWRWESVLMGCCFLFYLIFTRYLFETRPKFSWITVVAPLCSAALGSFLVYVTRADGHGIHVIGRLPKGLNPLSLSDLTLGPPYLTAAMKAGIVAAFIAGAEGITAVRNLAMLNNYQFDGNKEMLAFGLMNIAGSCTSCYVTTGLQPTVTFNTGCKTVASNIVMAITVMITLLFLMPLFHNTPLAVLSSIKIALMLRKINYEAAIHLWEVDKFDFMVCMSAYMGVVLGGVEIGLFIAVAISMLRVIQFIARTRTSVLGNIPNPTSVGGVLILQMEAPIYFFNASYLRDRISRRIDEEEDKLKSSGDSLQYVILDMGPVGGIDVSGINMLKEVKNNIDRRFLKLMLANPGSELMKKLDMSKIFKIMGPERIFLTVGEAVLECKRDLGTIEMGALDNEP